MIQFRQENFGRVKPALDFTMERPEKVIVVASEFLPMELARVFDDRFFFYAPGDSSLPGLHRLLKQEGVRQYLYISEADHAPPFPNSLAPGKANELVKKGSYYFAEYEVP
jgi:hypothetical protein